MAGTEQNLYIQQKKTLDDLRQKLQNHKKCAVLRPPGFGKTWLLTELAQEFPSVLYIYPSAVVRDTVITRYHQLYDDTIDQETMETKAGMEHIPGCTLMTYTKLAKLSQTDLTDMGYDLIIFDEMQRMGGRLARISIEHMFANNPDSLFVGATATPNRMDGFDAVSVFFSDIMTYPYTMHDAIQDDILKRPYYCDLTYDMEADLTEQCLTAGEDPNDPEVKAVLSIWLIELSRLFGVPAVIRKTCDLYAADTNYMKFIIFFASISHMDKKLPEVQGWFREAYPEHEQRILRISSKTWEETENTKKLSTLVRKDRTIDLIGCVDMLNLGYHVNDQTGIFMYRGTYSSGIFGQQMGHAMSAGARNSGIVFDLVDNLHRKAIYDMNLMYGVKSDTRRNTHYLMSKNGTVLFHDADGNQMRTQYSMGKDMCIYDMHGNRASLEYDETDHSVWDTGDASEKNITRITPESIYVTGHMASYREVMAKIVAEPMSQRCRNALLLHFRTWCHNHGLIYPVSEETLNRLKNLSKQDFYSHFSDILQKNRLDYPLHDAAKLLAMGQEHDKDVPLSICAEAKNVSVKQILDTLEIH